jgi:hypothetical protein
VVLPGLHQRVPDPVGDRHDPREGTLDVLHHERRGRALSHEAPVRRFRAGGEQRVVPVLADHLVAQGRLQTLVEPFSSAKQHVDDARVRGHQHAAVDQAHREKAVVSRRPAAQSSVVVRGEHRGDVATDDPSLGVRDLGNGILGEGKEKRREARASGERKRRRNEEEKKKGADATSSLVFSRRVRMRLAVFLETELNNKKRAHRLSHLAEVVEAPGPLGELEEQAHGGEGEHGGDQGRGEWRGGGGDD